MKFTIKYLDDCLQLFSFQKKNLGRIKIGSSEPTIILLHYISSDRDHGV